MSKLTRRDALFGPQVLGADLKSRAIQGGAVMLATEAIEFVLRLTSIVVLARLLIPEYFGIIAMVTAITAIVERFKDLGLSVAMVQRPIITHEQVSNLFWLNVAVGALLTLVVASLAPALAAFYGEPRLLPIALSLATAFFWSGLAVQHQALLRRQMRFGALAIVQIGATTLSFALAISLALLDFGYWALVAREVLRSAIMAGASWVALRWVPSLPSRRSGVGSFVAFGSHVSAFNLVWFLSTSIDQILVGRLFGAVPLALYRQGVNLVLQPIAQLSYPVNSVAESTLSRLQDRPEEYRRYYVRIVGALSALTMPLCAFLAVFADPIVNVVLGYQWRDAAPYFQLFAIAVMLRPATSTAGFVQVTCGMSRRYLSWGLLSATALIACVGTGTLWGPTGVAVGHIVYTYVFLVPLLAWGLRGTPVRLRDVTGAVVRPFAASLMMAGLMSWLHLEMRGYSHLAVLAVGTILAPAAYLTVWYLLPGGRQEVNRLLVDTASILARRTAQAR